MAHARVVVLPRTVLIERCEFLVYQHGIARCSELLQSPSATQPSMQQGMSWTIELGTALLWLEVAVLVIIAHLLGRLRDRMASVQLLAEEPLQGAQESQKDAADVLPTVESLMTEIPTGKDAPPRRPEFTLLDEDELGVLKKVQIWCKHPQSSGTRFEQIPPDLLVAFVRGYRYRPDWPNAAFAYLDRAFRWRQGDAIDEPHPMMMRTVEQLPKERDRFESFFQCCPVGTDDNGHPVLLERFCESLPDEIFASFDEAQILEHLTYNREVQRAFCAASSMRTHRRVFKSVVIMDLKGLAFAHTSKRMVALMRTLNARFSYNYPESVAKIYVINAPFVFSALWTIVKNILHPITVAKLEVCSSDHYTSFAKGGVRLDGGALPEKPSLVGYYTQMQRLRAEIKDDHLLLNGWLAEEDLAAMHAMGHELAGAATGRVEDVGKKSK